MDIFLVLGALSSLCFVSIIPLVIWRSLIFESFLLTTKAIFTCLRFMCSISSSSMLFCPLIGIDNIKLIDQILECFLFANIFLLMMPWYKMKKIEHYHDKIVGAEKIIELPHKGFGLKFLINFLILCVWFLIGFFTNLFTSPWGKTTMLILTLVLLIFTATSTTFIHIPDKLKNKGWKEIFFLLKQQNYKKGYFWLTFICVLFFFVVMITLHLTMTGIYNYWITIGFNIMGSATIFVILLCRKI